MVESDTRTSETAFITENGHYDKYDKPIEKLLKKVCYLVGCKRNQIESLDITQNLRLYTIILNYNLFPGTAILDQFYSIRSGENGILGGALEVSHNLLTGKIPNF